MVLRKKSFLVTLGIIVLCASDVRGQLTKQEALHVLGTEVLQPSSNTDEIQAIMLPAPLASGIVEPGFGAPPSIDIASISGNPQWFAMVDLFPCAFFAHDVIYVFIDDLTSVVTTFPADDWPYIDGIPVGEGTDLILVFPLLPRPFSFPPGSPTTEPFGDYGDAPDGQPAYHLVTGAFPTFYATTNSVLGRPGAHALTTGLEMVGAAVSVEQDVLDPADPDGTPNIRDADSDERMFLSWDPTTTPPTSHLIYDVTVAGGAPAVDRFVNVLFDFDRDGRWSGAAAGTEWAVVNQVIAVAPGTTATQISPPFPWADGVTTPTHVWARVALTRSAIDPGLFGAAGWDGSGAFDFGEIEDFEFYLADCPPEPSAEPPPQPPGPGEPPPPPPPPPGPPPPGPLVGCCGYPIKYFALVVQGKDHPRQRFVASIAQRMESFLTAQGYNPTTRLSGPTSSLADISAWIGAVKGQIVCEDRVLVYFIAHGRRNSPGGKLRLGNGDVLTGAQLDGCLDQIPPCPGEWCDEPNKSCFVTVLLESCFSGQWHTSLPDTGRTVISSTSNTYAWVRAGDGYYSRAWKSCSGDLANDTNGDGGVDPSEGHECAKNSMAPTPLPQVPMITEDWCECNCIKDFGDAPDGGEVCFGVPRFYRTLLLINGPRYDEPLLQRLGMNFDCEHDGQPTCGADGDDTDAKGDDEDGVLRGPNFVDVTVTVGRPDPNDYRLDAWFDLNNNGFFDEPAEQIIDSRFVYDGLSGGLLVGLTTGTYVFHYDLQFDPRKYYSRFRLTFGIDVAIAIFSFGEDVAADGRSHGEVEDYAPVPAPDQLHLVGPIPNEVSVGEQGSVSATVQVGFVSLPGQEVVFTKQLGSFTFTNGDISPDGTQSTVVTDADGEAEVTFVGDAPGEALIEVTVTGTELSAFSFFNIVGHESPPGGGAGGGEGEAGGDSGGDEQPGSGSDGERVVPSPCAAPALIVALLGWLVLRHAQRRRRPF